MKTYTDIFGWFSFESFYGHIADTFLKDGMNIIEVGAFMGRSTSFLAGKIKEKNLKLTFTTVDHWQGSVEHKDPNSGVFIPELKTNSNYLFEQFSRNINDCGLTNYVTPLRNDSIEASEKFPDQSFDFIFIDASHDYEHVKYDIEAWLPKLKLTNAIMGGDDYHPVWGGVIKAVDEKLGSLVLKDFPPAWYIKR